MKLTEFNDKIVELQTELEELMEDLTGETYEVKIEAYDDTMKFSIYGDLEFLEVMLDEFNNLDIEVESYDFKWTRHVIRFLENFDF